MADQRPLVENGGLKEIASVDRLFVPSMISAGEVSSNGGFLAAGGSYSASVADGSASLISEGTYGVIPFVDSARTVNNRRAYMYFANGEIGFGFHNDAVTIGISALSIKGGQALGVSSVDVLSRFTASGESSLGGAFNSESLRVSVVPSAVNRIKVAGSVTSVSPSISAEGVDANLDINLSPKGTGAVISSGKIVSAKSIDSLNPVGIQNVNTLTQVTLADAEGIDYVNFSGLIILTDIGITGSTALYLVGGGQVVLLASTNGMFILAQMTYVSGIDGYRWTNNLGSSRTISQFAVCTRANA